MKVRLSDVRVAIAHEIRAELVCCDIYQRLSTERDERRWRTEQTKGHDLCYWGEAAARIAESHELRSLKRAVPEEPSDA